MVNLFHPCQEIDVWVVEGEDEKQLAIRNGYKELDELRDMVMGDKECMYCRKVFKYTKCECVGFYKGGELFACPKCISNHDNDYMDSDE